MTHPAAFERIAAAHRAARTGQVVLRRPAPDVIVMDGSTRLGFLQRMSTNDFTQLAPGRLRWTVLTTPLARIVDFVQVLAGSDNLLLLTTPGRGSTVVDWLRKYVFFQDDLTLRLEATRREAWLVLGPAAEAAAAAISSDAPGLESGAWLPAGEVWIWHVDRPAAGGWAILGPAPAKHGLARLAEPDDIAGPLFEVLRIEAGIPAPGSEITDDRIPLEVGLAEAISLDKGCYIGQEIIARMTSRERLARRLVGVRLPGPANPRARLQQQGSTVGELTSVALSPVLGWIGLALVRPSALAVDAAQVSVAEAGQPAQLVELPLLPGTA